MGAISSTRSTIGKKAHNHKSCPDRNMVKADLVAAVEAQNVGMHGGEHTLEQIQVTPPVWDGVN